jgi:hypothetical protein
MANKIDTSSLSLGLGPYGKKINTFSFFGMRTSGGFWTHNVNENLMPME